jgi:carboxypeptidase C (cathepsin A)
MLDMHISIRLSSLCLGVLLLSPKMGWAEPNAGDAPTASKSDASGQSKEVAKKEEVKHLAATIPDAKDKPILTSHTVTLTGQPVSYVAETGMLPLLKSDGTVRASIFYVAYMKQGESRMEHRPVTFCFNGGPSSSSVWLHLGALGPRRVRLGDIGASQSAPLGLVDNEFSLLDVTDLVFIDPMATGYSRPAGESKAEQFFGKSPDIESISEFIRLWTTRHDRWLSPKYICGESYGVFRAAGVARYLHSRYGMTLNGLILVSGLLSFDAYTGDKAWQALLPAYTAVAHYHKRLPPDLQADLPKALAEARDFMRTEYAAALFQGTSMTAAMRARVAAKLSRLTGLPAQVIEDNDLRIDNEVFRKELLRDRGLILGRYDARITGSDADPASRQPDFDPSFTAIDGAFSAAINAYVRGELKFEDDLPYGVLNRIADWKGGSRDASQGTGVRQDFASEMQEDPQLRVLVLSGRCDLACPVDVICYDFDHLKLDPAARARITYAEFEGGHMMYIDLPDLRKMQKDIGQFVRPR